MISVSDKPVAYLLRHSCPRIQSPPAHRTNVYVAQLVPLIMFANQESSFEDY